MSEGPILRIYKYGRKTELHTDACKQGYGAILLQEAEDGKLHPVYYMSKKTNTAEEKYDSYELEKKRKKASLYEEGDLVAIRRTQFGTGLKLRPKFLGPYKVTKGNSKDRFYKEPQVTQVIRSNRLRWLGHIWRSPENNQTRAYTFKNPMGSRTRGRPPTRWIDDVENDLKTLNIKNWHRVAAYCWNWRKRAVEAAKTCNWLLRL
ncbi:endonuclease-reverse transcriptase [Trichonephila clavipes]|nr:endonuclease-reverse transcriptase [Trichonephila clavipes]